MGAGGTGVLSDDTVRDVYDRQRQSYTSWPNMMDAMYHQDRWDRGIRD